MCCDLSWEAPIPQSFFSEGAYCKAPPPPSPSPPVYGGASTDAVVPTYGSSSPSPSPSASSSTDSHDGHGRRRVARRAL